MAWRFTMALVPAMLPERSQSPQKLVLIHPSGSAFLTFSVMRMTLSRLRMSGCDSSPSMAARKSSSSVGEATHPPAP